MPYKENRVRVSYYGSLTSNSPLLVPVLTAPGYKQQRLHILAAQAFSPMSNVIEHDLGYKGSIASGWRHHRWISREEYERFLIKKYGSVEKGRLFIGFNSPHETGLAIDFGCGGLTPNTKTIEAQKKTELFKWLVENAYDYGWTPYKIEPWHWEYNIPLEAYKSGKLESNIEAVKPLIEQNYVCEDFSCIELPWKS